MYTILKEKKKKGECFTPDLAHSSSMLILKKRRFGGCCVLALSWRFMFLVPTLITLSRCQDGLTREPVRAKACRFRDG